MIKKSGDLDLRFFIVDTTNHITKRERNKLVYLIIFYSVLKLCLSLKVL